MEGYKELYFSFKGRATRTDLWIRFYLLYFLASIAVALFDTTLMLYGIGPGMPILSIIFYLVAFYVSIAVNVKRAHDRNRSGWFILLFLVPILNIWPFIELGFLRGTKGENRFGQDLLA